MGIKELRQARGWTQVALGARVGLTQASVSAHETGKALPDVDTLRRYAAVFEVPVDEILRSGLPAGAGQAREDIAAAIRATAQAMDKAAEAMRMAAEAHLLLVKRYADGTKGE